MIAIQLNMANMKYYNVVSHPTAKNYESNKQFGDTNMTLLNGFVLCPSIDNQVALNACAVNNRN